MQQRTLWAERVPNAPYPMRVADLLRLPDDGYTYEIVEGELLRMPGSGVEASRIAARLMIALGSYVEAHSLGDVLGADGTYDLTQPGDTAETALVPDVSFARAGRLPKTGTPAAKGYAKLAPDLVAEVASPSQYRPEMTSKAQLYLGRGVRLVWIIWPGRREVDVWRPATPTMPEATLTSADALDGLDVVSGFTYPLARLFA